MAAESKLAIYGAIAANVAIAATKFTVAGITGSSAMLSEGIHSAVDTFNGILLLVGIRLSQRPATAEHPFGHGKELYFWSLIVAVLIFGLGGGVSFYEGIQHIRKPEPMRDPGWNYVVLGLAALFEGASFLVALRQFRLQSRGAPFWRALGQSKDPGTYTVLAGVAVLLIAQARGLLIGEGIRPETARAIRSLAMEQPSVQDVGHVLSMYIGPDEVLAVVDLNFREGTATGEAADAIAAIEQQVRGRFPMIRRLFIEASEAPVEDAASARAGGIVGVG